MEEEQPMKWSSWIAFGFYICGVAGGVAAIPLLVPGLELDIARKISLGLFPLILATYGFALWRETR